MIKKKILWLSDHALMHSGVATQSKFLMEGLLSTNQYSIYQLGAAAKHDPSTKTIKLSEDWIIEPVNGFGTQQQIRKILLQWKPDVIFIFTDPRFFHWLFEMEDEVHQFCPIVWWHVWDNYPFPEFNRRYYDATDALNCHSHLTYTMLQENGYKDKTKFIPHAVPKNIYFQMSDVTKKLVKEKHFGEKSNHWTLFWNNKNFDRKRPADLIVAWSLFADRVKREKGHSDIVLFLHTDPKFEVGANMIELSKHLGCDHTILYSNGIINFQTLNEYYNISDCTINISHSEGFGLSTLESMMTGTPIIAPLTGGQTRQIIDHRSGEEMGKALPIEIKLMNSTQNVPYIYEDYCSVETIAQKIWEMYTMDPEEYRILQSKVLDYANSEFNYEKVVQKWHESLQETIRDWKQNYRSIYVEKLQ